MDLTSALATPGSGMQDMSQHFWSSRRLWIGGEHAREGTSGPREGHSGSGVQQRERAEQPPDKEQLTTDAKQLA